MEILFRHATTDDLPDIVRMLADDFLGESREQYEDPLPESYGKAFRDIEADPNNELIVVEFGKAGDASHDSDAGIIGTMQLTFTPSVSFQGGKRATIESVRVDARYRGRGIGEQMMRWAIGRAKEKGCISVQLTTNLERKDGYPIYEGVGFAPSHLGMKLKLRQ